MLGSAQKDDLLVLPSGQLVLSRSPSSPKSESECLYNDAVASIRQTSVPHNYQLVVQRAIEDGEEQLKGDETTDDSLLDELEATSSGDERTFLIDQELNFHKYINTDGNTTVVWKDVSGDDGDKFAFICDTSVKESLIDQFLATVCRCQYERKYKKSSAGVTEQDLLEFKYDPSKETALNKDLFHENGDFPSSSDDYPSTESGEEEDVYDDDDDDDDDEFKDAVSGSPAKEKESASDSNNASKLYQPVQFKETTKLDKTKKVELEGTTILEIPAELHFFNPEETSFVLKTDNTNAKIIDAGDWKYWLVVEDKLSKNVLLSSLIGQDMSPTFNYDHLCFIYNYVVDDDATSWLLKFEEFEILHEFQTGFMHALWETLNKTKFGKIKEQDQDYIVDALNDLKLEDYEDEVKEIEKYEDNNEEEEEDYSGGEENYGKPKILRSGVKKQEQEYDSDDDDDEAAHSAFRSSNAKNKALAVSSTDDRSYVVRGDKIGVFKLTEDQNSVDFYTAIENIKNLKGQSFDPEKVMLHTKDTSLIMQDPSSKSNLYRMDLNRGQVVEEYKVGQSDTDINVVEFNPTQKFSQATNEETFLGLSQNGLFKIDPRLAGNNLVESEYKKYLSKTNFTAIATNAQGNIAVASKDGEIKLFDRLGINAKTRLPGLGEEIKGLDVSADGRWVLATCQTYLLLVEVQIKDGKNSGTTGFLKSFPKDAKPIPKILQLLPQHVSVMRQHTKKPLDFTVAHFNTGFDFKETSIISSSGPYVVRWSLRKILRGDKEPYLIKKYDVEVTADNFMFGTDNNAIVTTSDDVALVNKKKFKKPTRVTLGTSKDNIVKKY